MNADLGCRSSSGAPTCRARGSPGHLTDSRVRFPVTSPIQNAPFGHVAIASPTQSTLFREGNTPRMRLSVMCRGQNAVFREAASRLPR